MSNSDLIIKNERIFGLDLFRVLAIIIVVFGHSKFLIEYAFSINFKIPTIFGVDVFFVLSGFLIGSILLKEINRNTKFNTNAVLTFWKKRWWRTLPNYYLFILLNYILAYNNLLTSSANSFNWKFIFFLQNLYSEFKGFFWESWSLCIEEWFYLITPLFLFFLLKKIPPKKAFFIVIIFMILIPIIFRIYNYNPKITPEKFNLFTRKVVLNRLDSISFGLLASWVFYYYADIWKKHKTKFLIFGLLLIIFVKLYNPPITTIYKQILFISLSPISAMFILPFFYYLDSSNSFFKNLTTYISKISYSMYLINLLLISLILKNIEITSSIQALQLFFIFWIAVIILSFLNYTFFEKKLMIT